METLVKPHQLSAYYKDKKVFVTGHTGFKGAWLSAMLHGFGAIVKGYSLAPEHPNTLFDLLYPLNICESVIADIRDRAKLEEEVQSFRPDYIFHLAAQPLVRKSYEIPAETFEVNVAGTANLLEAVTRLQNKCSVVIITTDKVYENRELNILYKESDKLGGYDPYSASKACAELVVSSFRNSFFRSGQSPEYKKGIASARAGNVIGGGDWSDDRIVPDIVRSLQQERTVNVRNPGAVRPWQHVLEPLTGYLILGALLHIDLAPSAAYNFGPNPGDHLTVKELVLLSIAQWGSGQWKDISNSNQPHEAQLLQLDIGLASHELQWMPKLNAVEAICWTLDWYKQPLSEQVGFTLQQIKNYLAL